MKNKKLPSLAKWGKKAAHFIKTPALTYSILLLSLLAFILSITSLIISSYQPKIAFVRSQELVFGYKGMEEAHALYIEKVKQWDINKQALKSDFHAVLAKYEEEEASLSKQEKNKQKEYLEGLVKNLEKYERSINQLAEEEDKKMTQAALNQINSFITKYGEAKGYDVVLGTTSSGSVLYGKSAIDITDEVLEALNRSYYSED